MFLEVNCECVQNRMGFTVPGQCRCKVAVQPLDGHPDGTRDALSGGFGAGEVSPLKFGYSFEFSEGLRLLGFGGVVGVKDGFEFFLFAVEGAERLGIVERERPFLEPGMAWERDGFPGSGFYYFGEAELVAVNLRDFGHEVEGVDRFFRRVVKEPDNVEEAALVFDVSFLAVENEVPYTAVFAEGVLRAPRGWGEFEARSGQATARVSGNAQQEAVDGLALLGGGAQEADQGFSWNEVSHPRGRLKCTSGPCCREGQLCVECNPQDKKRALPMKANDRVAMTLDSQHLPINLLL